MSRYINYIVAYIVGSLFLLSQIQMLHVYILHYVAIVICIAYTAVSIYANGINKHNNGHLLVYFILICFISIFMNNIPLAFKPVERFVVFVLVLLATSSIIENDRVRVFRLILTKVLLQMMLVLSIFSTFAYYVGFVLPNSTNNVYYGLVHHSNVLGPISAMSILYLIHLSNRTKLKLILKIVCIPLCFVSLLLSSSRAAIVACALGLFCYLFILYRHRFSRLVLILMMIITGAIVTFPLYKDAVVGLQNKMNYGKEKGSSIASRDKLWSTRIDEFVSSPVYGIGFNTVSDKSELELSKDMVRVESGSAYLGLLSMTGILGFLFCVSYIIKVIINCFRLAMRRINNIRALLLSLTIFFACHIVFEAYLTTVGWILMIVFWLCFACAELPDKYIIDKEEL